MNKKNLIIDPVVFLFIFIVILLMSCNYNQIAVDKIKSRELIFPQHPNYYSLFKLTLIA